MGEKRGHHIRTMKSLLCSLLELGASRDGKGRVSPGQVSGQGEVEIVASKHATPRPVQWVREPWLLQVSSAAPCAHVLWGSLSCLLGRGGPKSHNVRSFFVLNVIVVSLPGCFLCLCVCLVWPKLVVTGRGDPPGGVLRGPPASRLWALQLGGLGFSPQQRGHRDLLRSPGQGPMATSNT